ncbi:MAG: hypothetical protein DRQ55_01465 [Planctomycetota bacterium]|nr:MAG: hypothetical protein DRQ55_01465 [Planctomycetota bacterium]
MLALLVGGCGIFEPTIAVDRVGSDRVYATLNRTALVSDEVSAATGAVLHQYSLTELSHYSSWEAVQALHEVSLDEPTRENLFALAELSFHHGRQHDECTYGFLASAVYAWLYLMGDEDPVPPNPYDRRFRWACDLYNSGLQRAFSQVDGAYQPFAPHERELPVGRLKIELDTTGTPWTQAEFDRYVPGDEFLLEGLSLRMRDSGLGVPLVGIRADGSRGFVPATALLRLHGGLEDLSTGVDATLELHSAYDPSDVIVGDSVVPLEADLSALLAYSLHDSPLWKFSLAGLFEGSRAVRENRLVAVRPLVKGRTPVVFIHGTASNPAYWAEMLNTLLGDPELRERAQFMFFQYASGNPIGFSALTLRQQLAEQIEAADPEGTDPGLNNVVLVGHSQGGLLVRMLISDGNMDWFEAELGKSLEDFDLPAEQEQLVRDAIDYRASPEVSRAVFISTPHRGSYRAAAWYSRMMAKFISVPGQIQGMVTNMVGQSGQQVPKVLRNRVPTSLDNMDPSSPLLERLSKAPIAPWVSMHSIIAIGDADPDDPEQVVHADDGVVEYTAAWMPGVESELLVSLGHSCQENPLVIQEVRRILREHLAVLRNDP